MEINLSREEVLACCIALDKEKKPYRWQQQALEKLDKAMGFKRVSPSHKGGGE